MNRCRLPLDSEHRGHLIMEGACGKCDWRVPGDDEKGEYRGDMVVKVGDGVVLKSFSVLLFSEHPFLCGCSHNKLRSHVFPGGWGNLHFDQ